MRKMVSFTLTGAGYKVVEAVDGMDALEKAEAQHVDLILADQTAALCWGCGREIRTFGAAFHICRNCEIDTGGTTCDERATVYAAHDRVGAWRELTERKRKAKYLPARQLATPGAPEAYAYATASGEVAAWAATPLPRLLVLVGPTGTGKTWQAWGALRALGREHQAVKGAGLHRLDRGELRTLVTCGVLLLDDLGARTSPGALASALEVIDLRGDERRLTIVTTNATFSDLGQIEPRLASRLAAGKIVKLAGRDRRVAGMEGAA
jgi:CheY-like chemotaxis protein